MLCIFEVQGASPGLQKPVPALSLHGESVSYTEHLRSLIATGGGIWESITEEISKARTVSANLQYLRHRHCIRSSPKERIFNPTVLSGLYGCETLSLISESVRRPLLSDHQCL